MRGVKNSNINRYNDSPEKCIECGSAISYTKKENKFCSHSCAAKHSNKNRPKESFKIKHSAAGIEKIILSNKVRSENRKKLLQQFIDSFVGPLFTKEKALLRQLRKEPRKCFCGNPTPKHKYCSHGCSMSRSRKRDAFAFNFNVYDYPDLFDLALLNKVGFCSFGGKRGKSYNPHGLSRDHKVSAEYAIINNCDPYYITHPCNCALIPMIENNKKKTKCSITYEELVRLCDSYDAQRGGD
jgi:predicted nucleic acid-binding Zn ribbon protein